MQKGKLYTMEALSGDPFATRNSHLFAALITLGIPAEPALCGEFVEEIEGVKRSTTVWRLREKSLCGKYHTAEMIKAWDNPEFCGLNSEHPLAYLKAAFGNYNRAIEFVKEQGPIAMRRRGSKIALITRHTSDENKARILDELNR